MTIGEKRAYVRAYCESRGCTGCLVGTLAKVRGEVRHSGAPKCWSDADVTEDMLDARINVIKAERGSDDTTGEHFVYTDRERKIDKLNGYCDGTTCKACPCDIEGLKKYCYDGHTCDFEEMSDEGLDTYLKAIEDNRCAKELAVISRAHKIRRLNELCGDQAEVCEDCPCHELAKNAGIDMLCRFDDMTDAMLDRYLGKFGDPAVLSGGGCSGHAVAPATETSLKDATHPHHYKLPGGMQVVDVEVAMFGREAVMHHCLCTAAEYILRSQQKNGVEDIKKAHWWLCKYIELEAESHGK